jgi:hypothetical protein
VENAAQAQPLVRPILVATVLGAPATLQALAIGLGTEVAAWWAPWALAAGLPYLLGARPGRAAALMIAIVALVAGPAPAAGAIVGGLAAEGAARGVRPWRALPLGIAAGLGAFVALVAGA